MGLILTDEGATAELEILFNNVRATGGNNLTLKLFCNDQTPVDTHTSVDYTEAAGGGYAAKALTMGSWIVSTVSNIVQAAYAQQAWSFTGALTTNPTVYGYYIVDADGEVFWAERLPTSFTPVNGAVLNITPKRQQSKGTPS